MQLKTYFAMAQSGVRHDFLKTFQQQQSVYALGDHLSSSTRLDDQFVTTSKQFCHDGSCHCAEHTCSVKQQLSSAYCKNVPSSFQTMPFEYDRTARFTSEQAKATKYVRGLQSNISKASCELVDHLRGKKHSSIYAIANEQPKIEGERPEYVTTQQRFHGNASIRTPEQKAEAFAKCGVQTQETGFTKAINKSKPILTDDVARYTSEVRKAQKYTLQPIRKIEQYAQQPEHKLMKTEKAANAYTLTGQIDFPSERSFQTESKEQYGIRNAVGLREKRVNGNLSPQTATAFVENLPPSGTTRPFEFDPTKRFTSEMTKAMKYTKQPKPLGWF